MTLLEALPKNNDGQIVLSPAGEQDGKPLEGTVDPNWFETVFPTLANAEVPLSDENFQALRSIDMFWTANADKWRDAGLI